MPRLPIVYLDGHLHIFPERLQRAIYQWFANDGWDIVYQDWYGERIVNYLQDLGCAGAAVLVYAHKPHMAAGLNEWLSHWSQSYPALRLFGTVHPDDPDLPGIVSTALDTYAFAGFKIHCNVQNTRADDPRWFPVYEAIVERDRAVIIHAGREPHRSSAVGFSYMAGVLARYPLLRVQIAHLGFDEIDDFAALLDHYPNVYLDTAAIPGTRLHLPESALHALIMRYPDRIIYGSDMPILEEPVTDHWWRIWNAAESEEIRQRIFVINARHFWGEA